jgi:Zn-dependent peptidase ImmA (M78 family)
VESIAEDLLGLEIERTEIDVSGMLFPAQRRILINAVESETRQRFTIAHELGHWVCQCLEGHTAPLYCRVEDVGVDLEAKALEREANVFAAELLMPAAPVQVAWAELEDPEAVAGRLDVSPSAVGWRLFNLGLLAERPT